MNIGFFAPDPRLRVHAELLCRSIRDHIPGAWITIIVPEAPAGSFSAVFRPMADRVLSLRYAPPHPFTDKIQAAALFEGSLPRDEGFLWMDVEGYFLKTPDFSGSCAGLSVNPVDLRNVGIPPETPWSPLWSGILRHFSLEEKASEWPFLETTVTKEKIRPYFNVGFVFVREPRNVFPTTAAAIDSLSGEASFSSVFGDPLNRIFFHQAVFAAAAISLYGTAGIGPLPAGYNYPLHLHSRHSAPADLAKLGSLRYDGNLGEIPLDPADRDKLPREFLDRRDELTAL